MKNRINKTRIWYEQLSLRERVLFMLLVWALVYAFFSLLMLRPVENGQTFYRDEIRVANDKIKTLEMQINAVNQIANSPLYQEWSKQQHAYREMKDQYKSLLESFSKDNWHDVIKSVMAAHNNITLAHIENTPETTLSLGEMNKNENAIYEQQLLLVVYGNYFDSLNYLQHLEKVLPNVHWNKLDYQVMQYPQAKIEMEFSVFYEKQKTA